MSEKSIDCDGNIEGSQMYELIKTLFGICRSITGDGVRETLGFIQEHIPELTIHEVPSGTQCFDWVIPQEWNIEDAYILGEDGDRVVDFKKNNLHVVGYSIPVDREITLEGLEDHLFSLPDLPEAIPYVTSYYQPFWGFCLSHEQRQKLKKQRYRVVIKSKLHDGNLTYADLVIKGKSSEEVFISTYICHPSMANNELSGPAVSTFLARWIKTFNNFYTYRFVFAPETIGPIVYLSRHLEHLQKNTIAAFNLTCVGDDRAVSFMPSHKENSLTDRVAGHVLKHHAPDHLEYDYFQDRGSDERQYCSPNVDLPMVSIMRSKYGKYPEYHTSLDNLSLVSPGGLQKSLKLHQECIKLLEANRKYRSTIVGEPQLGRRNLITEFGGNRTRNFERRNILVFLTCCDGKRDLIAIAEKSKIYASEFLPTIQILLENNLIEEAPSRESMDIRQ